MDDRKVLHIADSNDWLAAKHTGEYLPSSFNTDGFIHCCFEEQLDAVLQAYLAGRDDCVVLEVQEWRGRDDIKIEAGHDGQDYPHIYGPVRTEHLHELPSATP